MGEIAQIFKAATFFGKYSDDQTFKELLEKTVKDYEEDIYNSEEFKEVACEYCREIGWQPPQ